MQSSSAAAAQPEAILEWLQKEMGYRPLGPYSSSSSSLPTPDSIRKICRGNMIPVWTFILNRVKSEKTVENIRRNILVHGTGVGTDRKKRGEGERGSSREAALKEREAAEKEVERLRQTVRRQRKELKAKMVEVSREEAERKRMLDERGNYRSCEFTRVCYDMKKLSNCVSRFDYSCFTMDIDSW